VKPNSPDIPLHDIKPLVEINDHSFILFVALIVAGIVLTAALGYLLWRFWRQRKQENLRQKSFEALEAVDLENPKQAAYAITKHGLCFAEDSPRIREAYDNLVSRLAPYKYRKVVGSIDEETISYYQIFVGMIDV
jgi:hypothetical protein